MSSLRDFDVWIYGLFFYHNTNPMGFENVATWNHNRAYFF